MRIDRPNSTNTIPYQLDPSRLQVGQRLQVKVLSLNPDQEGLISIGGKVIQAKLEVQAQAGDQFWAAVKEADEQGIILSRDSLNNPKLANLNQETIIRLLNRGFGLDREVADTLGLFTQSKLATSLLPLLTSNQPQIRQLIAQILRFLPDWSKLNGKNANALFQFLESLGLEDERILLGAKSEPKQEALREPSVKMNLLKIIEGQVNQVSDEEKAALEELREAITGQQLWVQTGAKKNAYVLLHFVLQDQDLFYHCEVAMESARQGKKMDSEHCHIGLQVETKNLGKIGADVMIFENRINLRILHEDIPELEILSQQIGQQTKAGFQQIGFELEGLSFQPFTDFPYFQQFIKGQQRSGVDVRG